MGKKAFPEPDLIEKYQIPFPVFLESEPNGDALIDIYRLTAISFLRAIGQSVSPGAIVEGLKYVYQTLDGILDAAPKMLVFSDAGRQNLQCKTGCNHCCTFRVTCTWPSAMVIARAIKDAPELIEKLRLYRGQMDDPSLESRDNQRLMCPLNVEGLCSVYEFRPLSCRSFHSFSLARCIEQRENPNTTLTIPIDPMRRRIESVVTLALDECLSALNLDTQEVELIPAILACIDDPNSAADYANGVKISPSPKLFPRFKVR